jgi:hypothetical protein
MDEILQKCISKIKEFITLNCGIIDEKHLICNEEDLEKIHEDN